MRERTPQNTYFSYPRQCSNNLHRQSLLMSNGGYPETLEAKADENAGDLDRNESSVYSEPCATHWQRTFTSFGPTISGNNLNPVKHAFNLRYYRDGRYTNSKCLSFNINVKICVITYIASYLGCFLWAGCHSIDELSCMNSPNQGHSCLLG